MFCKITMKATPKIWFLFIIFLSKQIIYATFKINNEQNEQLKQGYKI